MGRIVIRYRAGYKYQLVEDYDHGATIVIPPKHIEHEFFVLNLGMRLTIKKGYAWDGPSGPVLDTKSAMRGSLVHDCLYQMIRLGLLRPAWKAAADRTYRDICREDGMPGWRAWAHFEGLKLFGGASIEPSAEPQVQEAP